MDTKEKIRMLRKRSADKSISREERQSALEEYKYEIYRNDKRKLISVVDQEKFNAVQSLAYSVFFALMAIDLGEEHTHIWVLYILAPIVFGVFLFLNRYFDLKFKKEPDDELSLRNKALSNTIGFYCAIIVTIIAALIYFQILGHDTLVIRSKSAILMIFSYINMMLFINKVIFLIIEGRVKSIDDETEAEE